MYRYEGNNIIELSPVTLQDIKDITSVDFWGDGSEVEDWSQYMLEWRYHIIIDMAEEFHDLGQFKQLPENLKNIIDELKRIRFEVLCVMARALHKKLPDLKKIRFGNNEREGKWNDQSRTITKKILMPL